MTRPTVTVVIPTLHAGEALDECVSSLLAQSYDGFEVVIVDNSGQDLAKRVSAGDAARVLVNQANVGFGAAINQGGKTSASAYIATLNDDAVASPEWLARLVAAMESDASIGMCASQVLLAGKNLLDSAGMLLCGDGSSKQRGHGQPLGTFSKTEEVLLPSGSAAIYRRTMLDEIGWFDESFFLYVEDTDLGLRARWRGWKCLYVPEAIVEHRYSHSAGRASPMKAYYVERNRIFLILKTFPLAMFWKVPPTATARYFWHIASMFSGKGVAAEFRNPLSLPWIIIRAHASALWNIVRLWRQRREIFRNRRIFTRDFCKLARVYAISPREVASQ